MGFCRVCSLYTFGRSPWSGDQPVKGLYLTRQHTQNKRTPSDRRLSAKLVPTFADRCRHVVGVTDTYGGKLGFLDRSRYFSIK
jgi:hypothetical protein